VYTNAVSQINKRSEIQARVEFYESTRQIETQISSRSLPTRLKRGVNKDNLIQINRVSSYQCSRNISISLWNARSVNNKISAVCSSIIEHGTDVFVITETWLNEKKQNCTISEFRASLSGCNFHSLPRNNRKGGGVAAITRSNLNVTVNKGSTFSSFEHMNFLLINAWYVSC
jgi:hypothetical protein